MENTSHKLVEASYKRKIEKYILLNVTTWRCFSAHFTSKPSQEKYINCKTSTYWTFSLWFTDLRIPVSTFRYVYVNEADDVIESDLNSELKIAATVMTWFSRGIPIRIGQSRRKWNILNTPIKTWIANLSICDEDNCCQCSSFYHTVSIKSGSLLCSPPRDF